MRHRLILKVTKFQIPPPKRLNTMVQNILGGIMPPPPPHMLNRVKTKNPDLQESTKEYFKLYLGFCNKNTCTAKPSNKI